MTTTTPTLLDAVLSRIGQYKSTRRGYMACCPAHHDGSPSLEIWEDESDGHIGLCCYANCSRTSICQALGLEETDLYLPNPDFQKQPKRAIIDLIDLARDKMIDPRLLFSYGLREKKYGVQITYYTLSGEEYGKIRQRTELIGNKGSKWIGPEMPLLPYGLERLKDVPKDDFLFIVEGESDCWTMWQWGFHALGIPGAKNARCLVKEMIDLFPLTIYISRESDKAGEQFAEDGMPSRLRECGYSGEIKILDLHTPYGCKDPNELNKMLFHEDRAKEFRTLILEAMGKQPEGDPPDYDFLAREYIMQLKEGIESEWPQEGFGEWNDAICELSDAFLLYEGRPAMIERTLRRMAKTNEKLARMFFIEVVSNSCPKLPLHIVISDSNTYQKLKSYQLLLQYQKFSRQVSPEGFEDFHIFAFVWLLSAIAARRICIQQGDEMLYTNINIMFACESTAFAKSKTARVATRMLTDKLGLEHLFTPIPDVTPERFVADMSGGVAAIPKDYSELSKKEQEAVERDIAWSGQKSMYWDEFGKLLLAMENERSPKHGFRSLLLELDSCSYKGKNTQSHGRQKVERPYTSFIGCAVPTGMGSVAKKNSEFWKDGSSGRMHPITPEKDDFIIKSLEPGKYIPTPNELIAELYHWHESLGDYSIHIDSNEKGEPVIQSLNDFPEHQMQISPKASKMQIAYREELIFLCNQSSFPHDLKNCYGRLSGSMLKIAMLFSSLDGEIVISESHMALSQTLCEDLRENLHRFYEQASGFKNERASIEENILRVLRTKALKAKDRDEAWMTPRDIGRALHSQAMGEIQIALRDMEGTLIECKNTSQAKNGKYRII